MEDDKIYYVEASNSKQTAALEAVINERAFQAEGYRALPVYGHPGGPMRLDQVEDHISVLHGQLSRANLSTDQAPQALHALRKIAAVAVAAMEQYGALTREHELETRGGPTK